MESFGTFFILFSNERDAIRGHKIKFIYLPAYFDFNCESMEANVHQIIVRLRDFSDPKIHLLWGILLERTLASFPMSVLVSKIHFGG